MSRSNIDIIAGETDRLVVDESNTTASVRIEVIGPNELTGPALHLPANLEAELRGILNERADSNYRYRENGTVALEQPLYSRK